MKVSFYSEQFYVSNIELYSNFEIKLIRIKVQLNLLKCFFREKLNFLELIQNSNLSTFRVLNFLNFYKYLNLITVKRGLN